MSNASPEGFHQDFMRKIEQHKQWLAEQLRDQEDPLGHHHLHLRDTHLRENMHNDASSIGDKSENSFSINNSLHHTHKIIMLAEKENHNVSFRDDKSQNFAHEVTLSAIQNQEEVDDSFSSPPKQKKQTKWDRLARPNRSQRNKSTFTQRSESPLSARLRFTITDTKRKDEECTFHPRLVSKDYNFYGERSKLGMHERNVLWMQARQQKLEEEKIHHQDKDLAGCTFKPNIIWMMKKIKSVRSVEAKPLVESTFDHTGVDKFVRRQNLARQNREEKEILYHNPMIKIPDHVLSKPGNHTVGNFPNFARKGHVPVASLKKPLAPAYLEDYSVAVKSTPGKASKAHDNLCLSTERHLSTLKDLEKNEIKVQDVTFVEAVRLLHAELHNLKI